MADLRRAICLLDHKEQGDGRPNNADKPECRRGALFGDDGAHDCCCQRQ